MITNATTESQEMPVRHLYVYYRAAPEHSATLTAHVERLQRSLRGTHCIQCGLLQRPALDQTQITWMESYIGISSGFADALDITLASVNFSELIDGMRHYEYFEERLPII